MPTTCRSRGGSSRTKARRPSSPACSATTSGRVWEATPCGRGGGSPPRAQPAPGRPARPRGAVPAPHAALAVRGNSRRRWLARCGSRSAGTLFGGSRGPRWLRAPHAEPRMTLTARRTRPRRDVATQSRANGIHDRRHRRPWPAHWEPPAEADDDKPIPRAPRKRRGPRTTNRSLAFNVTVSDLSRVNREHVRGRASSRCSSTWEAVRASEPRPSKVPFGTRHWPGKHERNSGIRDRMSFIGVRSRRSWRPLLTALSGQDSLRRQRAHRRRRVGTRALRSRQADLPAVADRPKGRFRVSAESKKTRSGAAPSDAP